MGISPQVRSRRPLYARFVMSAVFHVMTALMVADDFAKDPVFKSQMARGAENETESDDEIHSPDSETANLEVLLERSRDSETLRM